MLVVADKVIGVQHVDAAVIVIDLKAKARKTGEQCIDVIVDVCVEKRRFHIAVLVKVIDGGAVCDHAGRIAGQILRIAGKGGQRTTGGDRKIAAVLYEVFDGLAVARAHRRNVLAALQRTLRVDECVVKVAGEQHLVEFQHG